jgi:hypothetical protein
MPLRYLCAFRAEGCRPSRVGPVPTPGRRWPKPRYRYQDGIDEVERAKNRTKSRVRSKVEHSFAVLKLKFGL